MLEGFCTQKKKGYQFNYPSGYAYLYTAKSFWLMKVLLTVIHKLPVAESAFNSNPQPSRLMISFV